jgi:thioesterase domain-containing protein
VNTAAFLATLRARDVQIWAEGDRLRCSAPAGTLSPEFFEQLRERKTEILSFLDTADSLARQQRAIIPLQPNGSKVPVFAVAGHNGDVFTYRTLVRHLGPEQPFFGLQPPGLDGQSEPLECVEDLAAYFAKQISAFRPRGPRIIAGYCAGGAIAFELARQLSRSGSQVSAVALFGAPYATAYRFSSQIRLRLEVEWARVARHARALASLSGAERRSYIREKLTLLRQPDTSQQPQPSAVAAEVLAQRIRVQRATFAALRRHTPGRFSGRLILFVPSKAWAGSSRRPLLWGSMADHCEVHFGPDDCHTDVMLLEPFAGGFAEQFSHACATAPDQEV